MKKAAYVMFILQLLSLYGGISEYGASFLGALSVIGKDFFDSKVVIVIAINKIHIKLANNIILFIFISSIF